MFYPRLRAAEHPPCPPAIDARMPLPHPVLVKENSWNSCALARVARKSL